MIDAADTAGVVLEDVSALAVGVVDEDVEDGHAHHVGLVFIDEVEIVAAPLGVDEELDRSDAVGAVADDRGRDEVPFEGRAHRPSEVLADVERV